MGCGQGSVKGAVSSHGLDGLDRHADTLPHAGLACVPRLGEQTLGDGSANRARVYRR